MHQLCAQVAALPASPTGHVFWDDYLRSAHIGMCEYEVVPMCAPRLEYRGPPTAAHNSDRERLKLAKRWRLLGLNGWSESGADARHLDWKTLEGRKTAARGSRGGGRTVAWLVKKVPVLYATRYEFGLPQPGSSA